MHTGAGKGILFRLPFSLSAPKRKEKSMKQNDFVLLSDMIPDIIQDIRYFSGYNFIGDPIDGYEDPIAILTVKAAEALKNAASAFKESGYLLKIFDAYRPVRAVEHFIRWAEDEKDLRMKPYFYPDVSKSDLFRIGYIARRSSHSRGSTVDLTLFDMKTGKEISMGSPFDYFGKRSHTEFLKHLTDEEIDNRFYLRDTMLQYGFQPIDEEWWHFTLRDEPFPDTYFDFPVNINAIR